jgi:imidazolonepropionase-like amidohydrolase
MAIVGTAMLFAARPSSAQDVAITNARVIVGNGQVINSGTIVVRGGKIVLGVGRRAASTQGLRAIDAKGMSAVPGYIDAHKHVNTGRMKRRKCRRCSRPAIRRSCRGAGLGTATSRSATTSTRA